MKTFTAEELRGGASELRKVISQEPPALLTASGEPIALLVPVTSATVDETASAIRQARAQLAVKSIRENRRKSGRKRMTIAQVDRVVAASREGRRMHKSGQEKRSS
jgi:antitoxin (DNA-binding transcriptional repressor) of toxin-antitoxin stability system